MPEKRSEQSYIADVYGSAASFELVAASVGFPRDPRGKVFVDIGSSVSTAVKKLNEMGAFAVGIDLKYTSLKNLVESVEPSFTDPNRWNFPIARHIPGNLRAEPGNNPEKESWNPLVRLWRKVAESANDMVTWGSSRAGYLRRSEAVYKDFLVDLHSSDRKGIYVAGRSEEIPLIDNIADMVYSVAALSIFVIRDRKAFMDSMQEALRVTKSGSPIALDPWFTKPNELWTPDMLRNGQQFLKSLDNKGISYEIVGSSQRDSGGHLRIIAP